MPEWLLAILASPSVRSVGYECKSETVQVDLDFVEFGFGIELPADHSRHWEVANFLRRLADGLDPRNAPSSDELTADRVRELAPEVAEPDDDPEPLETEPRAELAEPRGFGAPCWENGPSPEELAAKVDATLERAAQVLAPKRGRGRPKKQAPGPVAPEPVAMSQSDHANVTDGGLDVAPAVATVSQSEPELARQLEIPTTPEPPAEPAEPVEPEELSTGEEF